MTQVIGMLAGVVSIAGCVPYFREILRRRTKPERASWFLWALLSVIAFFAQLAERASVSLWFAGMAAVGALAIFVLSIRFGIRGWSTRHAVALVLAGTGVLLWYCTEDPRYGLVGTMIVEVTATGLTLWKTIQAPETENYATYVLFLTASALAVLSLGHSSLVLMAYPALTCITNTALVTTIFLSRSAKARKSGRMEALG